MSLQFSILTKQFLKLNMVGGMVGGSKYLKKLNFNLPGLLIGAARTLCFQQVVELMIIFRLYP